MRSIHKDAAAVLFLPRIPENMPARLRRHRPGSMRKTRAPVWRAGIRVYSTGKQASVTNSSGFCVCAGPTW